METDSFSSPLSDSYTASPSSPPRALSEISTYSNFPAIPLENRDFGSDFASMYHAIFPPNLPLPSSLSLTPSTHSSFSGDDDATVTEQRLNQACLILECQEIRDRFELCRAHLQEISKQVEFLRRENAELRSANTELVKLLSSQTTFQSFLLSSSHPNRSFMDDFGRLNVGSGAPESHGSEEVSNISPTSVMENNRFQRRPNRERISLPKSISVRSSGYLKVNRPASASHDGPSRSTTRPQVPSPLVSGTQKVYVPGGVISNGAGKSEEEEAAAAALEMEVYNQGMFKTELCNKWQDTGTCPYGDHCQFAHGIKELRPVIRHPRYKTEVCRMVLAGDKCPYGHRCHFRHSLTEQEKLQLGTH